MSERFIRAFLFFGMLAAVYLLLLENSVAAQTKSRQEAERRERARIKAEQREKARLEAMPPVRGVLFHCCSCAVMCPCMVNDKDVAGCNITRIYHITEGGFMGKSLNGLTAVYVPHPDNLKKQEDSLRKDGEPIDAVLYLPEGISEAQRQNFLSLLAEHCMTTVWNNVLHRDAKIAFRKQADGYDVEIPGVFHAQMRSARKADGRPIIANHLTLPEGSRWHIGRSTVHDYQDGEEKAWKWSLPKKNGSWTFFAWGPHIES